MPNEQVFYELQRQAIDDDVFREGQQAYHDSWFRDDTVDFWRHKRMYETCRPVAAHYKNAKWLTIGDGRYGLDSVRLRKLFSIQTVLPTDLGSYMLEEGKVRGLFDEYRAENAEHLTFADNSFDVVFCKEAYHHLPRPAVALYEMIRVSRSVVILIEPLDAITYEIHERRYVQSVPKTILSKLLRRTYMPNVVKIAPVGHGYEESGNYCYRISVRETEKIIHGLDLGGLAWMGSNDHYIKGCEFELAVPENRMFQEISQAIRERDELCRRFPGYQGYSNITIVIFKEPIDQELKNRMVEHGYAFGTTLRNPILKGSKRNAGPQ